MFEQYSWTSQRIMNVRKAEIQKLWNFSGRDNISDYEFLLSVLRAFTVATEVYYPKCNNVNDAKGLHILYLYCNIILGLEVTNYKYWNWGFLNSDERSAVYCQIWLKGSQISTFRFAKRKQIFSKPHQSI